MNYIKFLLSQDDKKKHFLCGMVIGMAFTMVAAVVAGIAKEVYDKKKGGKFDADDMVATWIGGMIGQMITIIFVFCFVVG